MTQGGISGQPSAHRGRCDLPGQMEDTPVRILPVTPQICLMMMQRHLRMGPLPAATVLRQEQEVTWETTEQQPVPCPWFALFNHHETLPLPTPGLVWSNKSSGTRPRALPGTRCITSSASRASFVLRSKSSPCTGLASPTFNFPTVVSSGPPVVEVKA